MGNSNSDSSSLVEGIGDEVMLLMAVILAGLTLVVAWMSTHVPQDMRPITVFVFQNFGRHRRQNSNTTGVLAGTVTAVTTTPVNESNTVAVSDGSVENTPSSELENTAPTLENVSALSCSSSNVLFSNTGLLDNEQHHIVTSPPEDSSLSEDAELSQQVEDVLQEYTSVMEARDDIQLRQRRLRYFNCLLGEPSVAVNHPDAVPSTVGSHQPEENGLMTTTALAATVATTPNLVEARADGAIKVRIKYLDERQKTVFASPVEEIGAFKRKHFNSELSSNMSVRLIFNGRELKEGIGHTLESYDVPDDATIHCLVTERVESADESSSHSTNARASEENSSGVGPETDMGGLMFPLFAAILSLIWYCRISYRQYFNVMSTFALVGITLLFFAACIASWTSRQAIRGHGSRGQPPVMVHRITLES